jgi:tetratricopeptide (TPR) repeat protein
VAMAILLVRRGWGWPWNFGDWILLAMLFFPLVFALVIPIVGTRRRYNRLVEAASWGRWDEVLERLHALGSRVPPREAAARKAQALAGLGRIDEGLRVWAQFSDGSQVPYWMYLVRLSDLYSTARDRESAVAAIEKAAEVAPENPVVLLELAGVLLIFRNDKSRAGVLLNRVRSHKLSDAMVPMLAMVEGVLAIEEGRALDGISRLEESLAGLTIIHNPLVGPVVAKIHAYLALAHAARRDLEAARQHFCLAEPRLRALREDELLLRCQEAIGLPRD